MNTIESLEHRLRERFPAASLALDRPKHETGSWFLDVALGDRDVTVEWRPSHGFGISARSDVAYGERADEVYASPDEVFQRVVQLILSGAGTREPVEMSLAELRRHRDVSQVELARRLAVQQASISKVERRGDLLLGTLRSLVEALGGSLEVRACFDDEVIRIRFENATVTELDDELPAEPARRAS